MKKKVLLLAEVVGKEMPHEEELRSYVMEHPEELISILTRSFILNKVGEDIRKTGVKIYTTESIELPDVESFDEVIAYDEYGEANKERFLKVSDQAEVVSSDEEVKPAKKTRKAKK